MTRALSPLHVGRSKAACAHDACPGGPDTPESAMGGAPHLMLMMRAVAAGTREKKRAGWLP